ncbi:pseudouridine synthase [Grosmannia clavigera kw1407]|uniref:tRNA pseudouridine(55) synthase n=1 Tax=Grosmannia clavigera (strain kw1407 / UAMH 11150) TaxID=655863 RepID=F0XIB8_GROCL|nr:pseudouridine synthase [Grosmannia clavigera kw1407]EFX03092.1 pseudouridine synthase [Grosmannia clavigera kw1407]
MGMSSAQVIRDCQTYFNPSTLFRPLLEQEAAARARESNTAQRRRSRAKRDMRVKMGHGGTLDPLATGVLILGIGRGTKELPRFLHCTKTYETVVLFGASTDTYDRVGRILRRRAYGDITRARVEEALEAFRGRFRQMPPLYSALKMNGKPLYEYAREGRPIPREVETREVDVSALELLDWYEPGQHPHRWPADEAGMAEQSLAERVWRLERDQAAGKTPHPRSAEEERHDRDALAAHEDFKRRAEEKQDELVFDRPSKRRRGAASTAGPASDTAAAAAINGRRGGPAGQFLEMSGALGELPRSPYHDNAASAAAAAEKEDPAENLSLPDSTEAVSSDPAAAPISPKPRPGRGSNLIPPPPSADTPPPWEGLGPPAARIRLTVSSGFYVRSFCHDLGEKVGSAAMMAELARTRQSDFCAGSANCLEYDDISRGEAVWAPKVERLLRLWKDGTVAEGAEETEKTEEDAVDRESPAAAVAAADTTADSSADSATLPPSDIVNEAASPAIEPKQ